MALFSPAYFEDLRYTTEEWTSALVRDDGGGHRLVPVQVEPCVVPSLLRPLLRVELFDVDEGEATRRLIAAARGPSRPDGKPVFPGHGRATALTSRGEVGPRLPGVLPPVWNVGPRNPGFVGRDATLGYWPAQIPAVVLTEALTGDHRRDFHANRVLWACQRRGVDESQAREGARLRTCTGPAGTISATDAIVVAFASALPDPVVLTSDPHDLDALAEHTVRPITVVGV